jgi:MSHA pilin protein MshC
MSAGPSRFGEVPGGVWPIVSRLARSTARHAITGFSLVELVVVLIIVGILAVMAIAKFANRLGFDTQGFFDSAQSGIRYAQKEAIAKRRNVCLAFASNSVSLTFASTPGSGAACDTNLTGPAGQSPYTVSAGAGISFSPTPTNFSFDALGRPSAGQVIIISGDGTRSFTVEAETGYVHP